MQSKKLLTALLLGAVATLPTTLVKAAPTLCSDGSTTGYSDVEILLTDIALSNGGTFIICPDTVLDASGVQIDKSDIVIKCGGNIGQCIVTSSTDEGLKIGSFSETITNVTMEGMAFSGYTSTNNETSFITADTGLASSLTEFGEVTFNECLFTVSYVRTSELMMCL